MWPFKKKDDLPMGEEPTYKCGCVIYGFSDLLHPTEIIKINRVNYLRTECLEKRKWWKKEITAPVEIVD